MANTSPFKAHPIQANKKTSAKPQHHYWGNVTEGVLPVCINSIAKQFPGLTLVISTDVASSYRLARGLEFYRRSADLPILHMPDWQTLTYDNLSTAPNITSSRLDVMSKLLSVKQGILLVTITSLLLRIAPKNWLAGQSFKFQIGALFDMEMEKKKLNDGGYICTDIVREHGEYALRGSLIDIFPAGCKLPLRLDLFDNKIDSIRTFSPETQRTVSKIPAFNLLPAREVPLTSQSIALFENNWHELFDDFSPTRCSIYKDTLAGIASPGIEYYIPLFFDATNNLLDYLPDNTQAVLSPGIAAAAQNYMGQAKARYENLKDNQHKPILPVRNLLYGIEDIFSRIKALPRITISPNSVKDGVKANTNFATADIPDITIDHHHKTPSAKLQQFLDRYQGRTLICVSGKGRQQVIQNMLKTATLEIVNYSDFGSFMGADSPLGLTIGDIDDSMMLVTPPLLVLTEKELFGNLVRVQHHSHNRRKALENTIRNLTELQIGSPVVHTDYGVGRYQGLHLIDNHNIKQEFVVISYADDANLHVPVTSLDLLSRYSGATEALAPLHKLNSGQWEKAKDKALKRIHDTASELLLIYAQRATKEGFQFGLGEFEEMDKFSSQFAFEETPDQEKAIAMVFEDMLSNRAMDRLVCGDVGFGKTEIAMRASFLAVLNQKQVAILVPTTLLAQQHYASFSDRFANWPITIEVLSRFKTKAEKTTIINKLADGTVDIIIGTHSLLQPDITFKSLSLVIIDEEHRFGVRQKEQLKKLRINTDILTLTATPIPRTLNLAISGLRDLSLITTPPVGRLPIKTIIQEQNWDLIHEAIQRELLRNGQVFFLYHEVKSISRIARSIQELVPEAKVAVGHGQMPGRKLETVMADFYKQRINVLVCTTIVENGIDIPSANTMIVYRADRFGLAQLHQLRGRVGRSTNQAYAYFLTPPKQSLSKDAVSRLRAIKAAGELGLGFTLATHDMEIRGVGEMLGDEQSGQIQKIGYEMYVDMLERTIENLNNNIDTSFDASMLDGTEVTLHLDAVIPAEYLPDIPTRLVLYHRIAEASNDGKLQDLQIEIADRFGQLPKQTTYLFRIAALKNKAKSLSIKRVDIGSHGGFIEFTKYSKVDPLYLITLVKLKPKKYRLTQDNRLLLKEKTETIEHRFSQAHEILEQLEKRIQPSN